MLREVAGVEKAAERLTVMLSNHALRQEALTRL